MKISQIILVIIVVILVVFPSVTYSRHLKNRPHSHHKPLGPKQSRTKGNIGEGDKAFFLLQRALGRPTLKPNEEGSGPITVEVAGSSLPDCSHACGSCSPCRLVMVSFVCSLHDAETCPMAYKCMCKNKSYPVP